VEAKKRAKEDTKKETKGLKEEDEAALKAEKAASKEPIDNSQ
jgi:hypothetical protein